ncbi:MAG: hypothetical protein JSV66_12665, partial [Trueperaceae bacterium]
PEEGARMLALRSGEAHMVLKPSPADLPALEADPGFGVASATGLRVFLVGFNLAKPPMEDVRIRQAIHHALDIPLLVESILEDAATVASGVVSPGVFGYIDMELLDRYPYNPEGAIALLEEAGYSMNADGIMEKDGEPLVLNMLPASGRYLKDREIAEVIQEFLRQVGIQLDLDIFEWATTFTELRKEQFDYHLFSIGWLTTTTDADYTLYSNYRSDQFPTAGWNTWRYADDAIDGLLTAARASVDAAERAQLYAEVQTILAEQVPNIPVYNTIEVVALSGDVQGFNSHPIEYILDLFPVSLEGQ